MLLHIFRAISNGITCDVSFPQSGGLKGAMEQCLWSHQDIRLLELQMREIHDATPASLFPACAVPPAPINAQGEGRWVSQSSQLTRFPQPPLKLSVVALQAAWCYFTIVSVPVSSRVLQWFVTYSSLGFVVHFNSLTFCSKCSFRVLKSDAWRSEWIPPQMFFPVIFNREAFGNLLL